MGLPRHREAQGSSPGYEPVHKVRIAVMPG